MHVLDLSRHWKVLITAARWISCVKCVDRVDDEREGTRVLSEYLKSARASQFRYVFRENDASIQSDLFAIVQLSAKAMEAARVWALITRSISPESSHFEIRAVGNGGLLEFILVSGSLGARQVRALVCVVCKASADEYRLQRFSG